MSGTSSSPPTNSPAISPAASSPSPKQAGVVYSPFADKWSLSSDMDVNYMVVAEEM